MRKKKVNIIIHFDDKKVSRKDELLSKIKLFLLLSEMKIEKIFKLSKHTNNNKKTVF